MRIIAGLHRGRRLKVPKNLPVRPTTDRAREALFSILNHKVNFSEVHVLDLYSGTGSIGIEFCSRGCHAVTSVDADHKCVQFVQQTAEELKLPIQTFRSTAQNYLSKCAQPYDLIFADPPYTDGKEEFAKMVQLIQERKLLNPNGWFILEHSEQLSFRHENGFLEERKYGGCVFSFFQLTN